MNRKLLGYLLLTVSTVAAAIFASPIPVHTAPFAVSLGVMAFSLWLVRRKPALRELAQQQEAGGFDHAACLESISGALTRLDRHEDLSCELIHSELDRLIQGEVFDFAQNRDSLLLQLGYSPYSRVMGDFTRAERTLNRAWSAAVDNYPGEARDSLRLARELFAEVTEQLKQIMASSVDLT